MFKIKLKKLLKIKLNFAQSKNSLTNDVIFLKELAKKMVFEKFGIMLEEEIIIKY